LISKYKLWNNEYYNHILKRLEADCLDYSYSNHKYKINLQLILVTLIILKKVLNLKKVVNI